MVLCGKHRGCLHSRVREEACLHSSLELTTWKSAWMIISIWQWGIGCGLELLLCVCAAVIIMRSWQFLFDSCDFGQALGLCENAYRSWCFINMDGNDNLDQGYRMYTVPLALPQSCCMVQETDQVSLFSTPAVLILPWWNKTASQKFLVVFEAGGCEDLVMGVFKLSYLCEMGQCCFIPTFTEGEVRPSDATHQRLHKACGTESRFWPSFL